MKRLTEAAYFSVVAMAVAMVWVFLAVGCAVKTGRSSEAGGHMELRKEARPVPGLREYPYVADDPLILRGVEGEWDRYLFHSGPEHRVPIG